VNSSLVCLLKVQCQSRDEVIDRAEWAGFMRDVVHVTCRPDAAAVCWIVSAWGRNYDKPA